MFGLARHVGDGGGLGRGKANDQLTRHTVALLLRRAHGRKLPAPRDCGDRKNRQSLNRYPRPGMTTTYDFVIIGGGSAGCALANRLSADPANRVLVLEAGRTDWKWDVFIHMPAALTYPIGSRFYDWKYESQPEPHMNGRRIYHARGKVLGGSSSINGMIFQRGNPLDFERWGADEGMGHWNYAHCLPYFKRMENCLAGGDEYRGDDGPLELERGPATNPLFEAFFEAVQEAGHALTDDVNGFKQEGFAKFDRNVRKGRRLSSSQAYLHPVLERENLELQTSTQVLKILFRGKKAVGVRVKRGRKKHEDIFADEVILCGGAINSPQLLMLSGVGDSAELRQHLQPKRHYQLDLDQLPTDAIPHLQTIEPTIQLSTQQSHTLTFYAAENSQTLTQILDCLRTHDVTIHNIDGRAPSLDEVFAKLTTDGGRTTAD